MPTRLLVAANGLEAPRAPRLCIRESQLTTLQVTHGRNTFLLMPGKVGLKLIRELRLTSPHRPQRTSLGALRPPLTPAPTARGGVSPRAGMPDGRCGGHLWTIVCRAVEGVRPSQEACALCGGLRPGAPGSPPPVVSRDDLAGKAGPRSPCWIL